MRRYLFILLTNSLAACTLAAQLVWVPQGPGPATGGQVEQIANGEVSGAINAVAVHPADAKTIYIGAVNGGIWRTTDAMSPNPSWKEQLGVDRSLSIGAIAFDPLDSSHRTLAAGTGRFSSFFSGGQQEGVLLTTDGEHWTLLDGMAGLNISGVAPRGDVIVVSADDGAGVRPGIWRTQDKGLTWRPLSGAAGTGLPPGGSFDLASDPTDPKRLYTNGTRQGIFRSTNTGETWSKVSDAAIDDLLATAANVRIAVGNRGEVYVAIAERELTGWFRSSNGTGGWTALDLPATMEDGIEVGLHPGGQAGTNLSLGADRENANIVYIGGDRQPDRTEFSPTCGPCGCPCFPNSIGAQDYSGRLFRVDASKARGQQATPITHVNTSKGSAPHADSRDLAVDAKNNLIEVDDGGIYRRTTPRANTGDWESVNGDLILTEFHSIAWDTNANVLIGGAQDTGSPEQSSVGGTRWRSVNTADGGDVCVDADPGGLSVRYTSAQFLGGFLRRVFDPAKPQPDVFRPKLIPTIGSDGPARAFFTPLALNQVNPMRLAIGAANSVYESFDQGNTVEEIAPGIVVNSFHADPIAYGANGNPDILYFGAGDRVFVRTRASRPPAESSGYLGRGTG
ncbi:MAG TPA: RTX toxin, partial [Thermoanaerobaculia bacterium]|nr:RTX toxin [Thermoanaerobaculia bacterium]